MITHFNYPQKIYFVKKERKRKRKKNYNPVKTLIRTVVRKGEGEGGEGGGAFT